MLNGIYETDFLGFSYGFRPRRSQHDALDALATGIHRKKVNWVLDADIRGFFDAIDHGWLRRFLEHRIADKRVLRLISKWVSAGVIENGALRRSVEGAPQGASASPLLANVYLHYVFDLWAQRWRGRNARGDVLIVRYADDYIVGFEHKDDAQRFLDELRGRLAEFGLELAEEKTRLIEFGRFAAQHRKAKGLGRPETFDFLSASRTSAGGRGAGDSCSCRSSPSAPDPRRRARRPRNRGAAALPLSTISDYARRGVLPGRKLGRRWVFLRDELDAALRKAPSASAPSPQPQPPVSHGRTGAKQTLKRYPMAVPSDASGQQRLRLD